MHTVCKLPQELFTHKFETHICMYNVLAHCKINQSFSTDLLL